MFCYWYVWVGTEWINKQKGYGLVGIIEGPQYDDTDDPMVYLEMYNKHGKWELNDEYLNLLDNAMMYLQREMGNEE